MKADHIKARPATESQQSLHLRKMLSERLTNSQNVIQLGGVYTTRILANVFTGLEFGMRTCNRKGK